MAARTYERLMYVTLVTMVLLIAAIGLYIIQPQGKPTNYLAQIIEAEEQAYMEYLDTKIQADEPPDTYHPED